MAFVNEIIPESAKAGFNFPVKTLSDGTKPTLWKWTIDKERDIALVHINSEGGGYEGTVQTDYFVLIAGNDQTFFKGSACVFGDLINGQILEWKVTLPTQGVNSEEFSDSVKKLIFDALDAMGLSYNRGCLKAVSVEFFNNLI